MAITAAMVKELREKTGAGMLDCKKALQETDSFDDAVNWLRTKGLSVAAKKSDRVASEGLVAMKVSDKKAVVLEVNAETDFVARNDKFQAFVKKSADIAENCADVDALKSADYGDGNTVEQALVNLIATIGENMSIRRLGHLSVDQGYIIPYMHNQTADGMGKIGVLVGMKTDSTQADRIKEIGEELAMHIAASNPKYFSREDVTTEVLENERKIFIDQAKESGRPDNIIEKMVEGRIRKFYQESVLLEQTFIMNSEKTIQDVLADLSKELGSDVTISSYLRYELGEGVEKKQDDFAAEVAQMSK